MKNPDVIRKIYKYVDDTKIVTSIKYTNDVITLQESLDEIYQWQSQNNMLFNGGKFVRISSGPNQDLTANSPLYSELWWSNPMEGINQRPWDYNRWQSKLLIATN